MSETTVNQRLKFLLNALKMKAPAFARAIGVSETTFRNYIDRDSKPGTDVIEKIANSFEEVNIVWLVTGKGEPIAKKTDGETLNSSVSGEKNTVTNIGKSIGGTLNVNSLDSCKASLVEALGQITLLRSQLESSHALLAAKEDNIKLLQETVNLLRAVYTRPN